MADDVVGVVLIFLQEVVNAREGNLVDVLVNLLLGHTDTAVRDSDSSLVRIQCYVYGQVAEFVLELALLSQCLQLLRCVNSVANHLAQENLMIRVEELFDDGENVLGCNPDVTFLHILFILYYYFNFCSIICKYRAKRIINLNS